MSAEEKLLDSILEQRRLENLSDRELVLEALHSEAAGFEIVLALMTRLWPGWMEEDCRCPECRSMQPPSEPTPSMADHHAEMRGDGPG